MRRFGLIGYPLTHSFSKKYFEEKFRRELIEGNAYDLYPLSSIAEFPQLLKQQPELVGLNVTIPYKEAVIAYIDKLDLPAKEIGAVNCLKKNSEGKWIGYNTDIIGFEVSLKQLLGARMPEQAFILGTGGAAKAVMYVLKKLGIPFLIVSRTAKLNSITYKQIPPHLKAINLYINTTPLGTFPEVDTAAEIPYAQLTDKDFLFDLVYNPAETLFMKRGKEQGAKTANGLQMLELQAEAAWKIWNP